MRVITMALLVTFAGCQAHSTSDSGVDGWSDTGSAPSQHLLRVDIHPALGEVSDAEGVADVLPQSFLIDPSAGAADLVLHPAVTLSGVVTGWKTTPFDAPGLPGQVVPVNASLHLVQANSIHGRRGATDPLDGSYALRAVPGQSYDLRVLPADADLPFATVPIHLSEDTEFDVDLGAGASVWGTVTARGTPLVSAGVQAELRGGTVGAPITTDASGRFLLRVPPNSELRLISLGRDNGQLDPVVTTDWFAVDAIGGERNIAYGSLEVLPVVSGRVTSDGEAVLDARVVLTSSLLSGFAEQAHIVRTDDTGTSGLFDARVVPGRYQAQVILPRANQPYTPVSLGAMDISDSVNLGDIHLSATAPQGGVVVDPDGLTVAQALVQVQEIGFAGRSWTAVSDELGRWSLNLPNVPLQYTITPPSSRADLALTVATGTDLNLLTLSEGFELMGSATWAGQGGDQPLGLATVEVFDASERLWAVGLTDLDGRFRLRIAEEAFPSR